MYRKHYSIFLFIVLLFGSLAFGVDGNSQPAKNTGNDSRKLLKIIKWDERYEIERKTDVNYLIGDIEGESVEGLTDFQKEQVMVAMRNAVYKKMLEEKSNFKNYLLIQYDQFFTADEMRKLVAYYSTELMQMIINSQLEQKQLDLEDIKKAIDYANPVDEKAINNFDNSYLRTRNARFQEKVGKLMNDMIYKKLKEVIDLAYLKLPETIKLVKAQSYTQ